MNSPEIVTVLKPNKDKKVFVGRQIDKKRTKQIRIDVGYHKLIKVRAASEGKSIKGLVEEVLSDSLNISEDYFAKKENRA
jgi:plasmid stability protein